MVVEVVEPELQGSDTGGRENKYGKKEIKKERVKISSLPPCPTKRTVAGKRHLHSINLRTKETQDLAVRGQWLTPVSMH